MDKKKRLFLSEILKRDAVTYDSNNLILSPVGSGKSHLVLEDLAKGRKGRKLFLVSTTSLKESVNHEEDVYTTKELREMYNITDENIHLMTYAEFGSKIAWDDYDEDKFMENYTTIFCDEIHSLFEYFSLKRDYRLHDAIKYLFKKHEGKQFFYFTATDEKIKSWMNKFYDKIYRNVKTFDYNGDESIMRYFNSNKRQFTSVRTMMEIIDDIEDLGRVGEKGVIFNERIDGMIKIEEQLKSKGFNVIAIWSVNNKKHPMNEEQLRARDELLETGMIPEGYNFIIINGSMREGWNLIDPDVELVILNTLDETNRIQARGRVRKNIAVVAERVTGEKTELSVKIMRRDASLNVIENYLDIPLDVNMKEEIAVKLDVQRENGSLAKWTSIKAALKENGYTVEDDQMTVNGKRVRVSIITEGGF